MIAISASEYQEYIERQIVAFYKAGGSLAAMPDEFGVWPQTAREILVRHGVHIRNASEAMVVQNAQRLRSYPYAERDATIARYYRDGDPVWLIAMECGLSGMRVRQILREQGVTLRSRRKES